MHEVTLLQEIIGPGGRFKAVIQQKHDREYQI
jgi:hypothetical protein